MKDNRDLTEKEVAILASKILLSLSDSGIPPSVGICLLLEMIASTIKALGCGKKELADTLTQFLNSIPPDFFDGNNVFNEEKVEQKNE